MGDSHVIDNRWRLVAIAVVVAPHEDQVVVACIYFSGHNLGLPCSSLILFAAERNPALRGCVGITVKIGCAVGKLAGGKCGGSRSEPSAEIVVVAFTLGFPLIKEFKPALGEVKELGGVHDTCAGDGVGIGGAAVIGNVKGMRAAVSDAPSPFVGLRSVDEIPSAGGAFKVVVPKFAYIFGHGSSGEADHVAPDDLVGVADRSHTYVVSGPTVKA